MKKSIQTVVKQSVRLKPPMADLKSAATERIRTPRILVLASIIIPTGFYGGILLRNYMEEKRVRVVCTSTFTIWF